VPVLLATSLVVQKALFESRYDVSGHAAEHLSTASVAFLAFALVATLLYVTPRPERRCLRKRLDRLGTRPLTPARCVTRG
jgi:hypothetical protein